MVQLKLEREVVYKLNRGRSNTFVHRLYIHKLKSNGSILIVGRQFHLNHHNLILWSGSESLRFISSIGSRHRRVQDM